MVELGHSVHCSVILTSHKSVGRIKYTKLLIGIDILVVQNHFVLRLRQSIYHSDS